MKKILLSKIFVLVAISAFSQATTQPTYGKIDAGFSLANLRKLSNTAVVNTKVFYLNEAGKQGFFQYDATDNTSPDNTGTIVVTTSGKRLKRVYDSAINVKWFEAKGDSVSDDTQAIKNALAAIPPATGTNRGGQLYFPKCKKFYRTTSKITIDKNFIQIQGESELVIVRNYGVGEVAFEVSGQFVSFRDLSVWGNGNAFGVGGTTSYGIHLKNANNFKFLNVNIRYHGSHGIYCSNGVWVGSFMSTEVSQNLGDGVNSNSPSSLEQNGNAFSFVNCTLAYNTGSGLSWKASALNVNGCTIEGNKAYGILVNCTGLTNSSFGINITGNYFESSALGELRFVSITGTIVQGVTITGNHLYSSSATATSLITFVGGTNEVSMVHLGKNSYIMSNNVVNVLDGGGAFRQDCFIDDSFASGGVYPFINLGNARTHNKILNPRIITATSTGSPTVVNLTSNDDFVFLNTASGTLECVLPNATLNNRKTIKFEKLNGITNDAKISPFSAGQLLGTTADIILKGQYAMLTLQCDGTYWYIVNIYNPIITANNTDVVTTSFLNTTYPNTSFPVGTTVHYYVQNKKFEKVTSTIWVQVATTIP